MALYENLQAKPTTIDTILSRRVDWPSAPAPGKSPRAIISKQRPKVISVWTAINQAANKPMYNDNHWCTLVIYKQPIFDSLLAPSVSRIKNLCKITELKLIHLLFHQSYRHLLTRQNEVSDIGVFLVKYPPAAIVCLPDIVRCVLKPIKACLPQAKTSEIYDVHFVIIWIRFTPD